MLRCYLGGALQEAVAEQDEDVITQWVREDLAKIMRVREEPVFSKVYRNRKSNVQYHVGHADLIDSISSELKACPGLFLAGSAYTGIGIPDCIRNGTFAAESVLQFLAGQGNPANPLAKSGI